MNEYDFIVVGAGLSGIVTARQLAENGKKVLVLEKRKHIGGNCYDYYNDTSCLVHLYGPHIFHTNNERVYTYLSNFTKWYDYIHKVEADADGERIIVPFSFYGIDKFFGNDAERLKAKLTYVFGENSKVVITDLIEDEDEDIRKIGFFVYENIFLHYSKKQWGHHFEKLDLNVFGRVPVYNSYKDTYFDDKWQALPLNGYTPMFENIGNHKNITFQYNTDSKDIISFNDNNILINNKNFEGKVIFTGCIDELFDYKYGKLPYRTLDFDFETFNMKEFQSHGVINYTKDKDFTRITEFKHLTGQDDIDTTTIVREFPREFDSEKGDVPFYPIPTQDNIGLYEKYVKHSEKFQNLYLLGRLAEYKYYNMDLAVLKALELSDMLKEIK